MEQLPKLRSDIQILPAQMQGQQVLAVRDLLGIREEPAVLAPQTAALLSLFDGEHTILDLQESMMRSRGGQLVMRDEAEQVVRELDGLILLQTPGYHEKKQAIKQAFFKLEHRPAHLVGTAYPAEPDALDKILADIVSQEIERVQPANNIRALVAPHIDLKVGKQVYGKAYAAIRKARPKRVLVLGTGHSIEEGLFCVTNKNYTTPLGVFQTDREAADKLCKAGGVLMSPDDFAHRNEHAIEFQVLFLGHLLNEDVLFLPVLLGSIRDHLDNVSRPREIPNMLHVLDALAAWVDQHTLIVAGVDFSHVGPKFGHPEPASYYEEEFRTHDQILLDALCRGSATDFWAEGCRIQDQFNVCGFPVLAVLLEVLANCHGEVLDYRVWHEPSTRSAVSYAAMVMN